MISRVEKREKETILAFYVIIYELRMLNDFVELFMKVRRQQKQIELRDEKGK
jgi:hypothetical protein